MASHFTFGAQPTVLRCGRCGKSVDWQDARLQVVCQCRAHLDLPPVLVREGADDDRVAVMDLFRRDFGRSKMVAFGSLLALDDAPALVAVMKNELAGALAYRLRGDGLQIVALATEATWQRSGVGGYLVAEAELLARRLDLPKVVFCTTNDNLPSLYFYQRRGYQITEVIVGALVPHNPPPDNTGFAGIEVRDEIRLEKVLTSQSSPVRS
ncbi:MAG: GNAT family N-acetyltransferase [Acidobacteria bacterium]|nr:GNAT family N-acetyltransferase [Acidobacteriota bacterium]